MKRVFTKLVNVYVIHLTLLIAHIVLKC